MFAALLTLRLELLPLLAVGEGVLHEVAQVGLETALVEESHHGLLRLLTSTAPGVVVTELAQLTLALEGVGHIVIDDDVLSVKRLGLAVLLPRRLLVVIQPLLLVVEGD